MADSPLPLPRALLAPRHWPTWALLVHDPGTIVACSITLTITAFNLIWFILRRLGLRALFVRASDEPVLPCTQPALARS